MTPEEKNRHEYILMEFRLGIEDVKDHNRDLIDRLMQDEIKPIKKRVSSLEHWRTFLSGAWAMGMAMLAWVKVGGPRPH